MKTIDKQTVPTKQQLVRHYREAIQYLDDNYVYFLTHVLKIGKPEWTAAIPTAAVQIQLEDKNGILPGKGEKIDYNKFSFVFNPRFGKALEVDELAFVLSHETMHILLNHLKLSENFVNREKLTKLAHKQQKGKKLDRDEIRDLIVEQQNAMRFNIAADCVINDYLVNAGMTMFQVEDPKNPGTMVPGGCRGQDQIGMNASQMTVTEVYDMLKQQGQGKCPQCGGSGKVDQDGNPVPTPGKGEGDQDGDKQDGQGGHEHDPNATQPCPTCQGNGQGVGGTYQQMDDHGWMLDPNYAEELADAISDLQDQVEAGTGLPTDLKDKIEEEKGNQTQASKNLQKSLRAGTERGNMMDFVEQTGADIAWAKLLKDVDPDIFKEPGIAPPPVPSFHQRRRKLGSAQLKRVHLPVYRIEERREELTDRKPAIVLALDTSGSIGPRDAQRFVSLAKTIPVQRIKLFCCTFETSYVEIDPQTVGRISAGGGTDFDAIVDFIDDRVKPELKGDYPKAVVVITDGQAPMNHSPSGKEADSWLWLISPRDASGSYSATRTVGRRAMLDQYIA